MPIRAGVDLERGYPLRSLVEMAAVRWTVFHHTGEGPGRPSVWDTARYQTGKTAHLEFPAIAYHIYIEADGRVYQCHPLERVTWHAGSGSPTSRQGIGSHNWESIGVCFSGENPTPAQVAAMREVADEIDRLVGRRLERRGHREVSVAPDGRPLTTCPGPEFPRWRSLVG